MAEPTYFRAWLVADDITVPAIAKDRNITFDGNDRLFLTFAGGGAELYAIAIGKHYTAMPKYKSRAMLRCQLAGTRGKLQLNQSKEIYIPAQSSDSKAIVVTNDSPPVKLSIVESIFDKDQIVIAEGGEIEVSGNIANKEIKVFQLEIEHPEIVLISQNSINNLKVNLIYELEGETRLREYHNCKLVENAQTLEVTRRKLELIYQRHEISDRVLP